MNPDKLTAKLIKAKRNEIKERGELLAKLQKEQQAAVLELMLLKGEAPRKAADDRLYAGWQQGRDGH